MIKPYVPTPLDLAWFQEKIFIIRHGGRLTMPAAGLVYIIDKEKKAFILDAATPWDKSPMTMLHHHHNHYILDKLGWKCLPEVDWSKDLPEEKT